MARTCFPSEDLNGNNGHTKADVTCELPMILFNASNHVQDPHLQFNTDIIFTGDKAVLPDSAIGENYLTNFALLTSMGDSLMNALVGQLGL